MLFSPCDPILGRPLRTSARRPCQVLRQSGCCGDGGAHATLADPILDADDARVDSGEKASSICLHWLLYLLGLI